MSVKLAMRNRDNVQLGYTEAQTGGYIIFLPNGDTYHVCSADFVGKFTPLPEAPEVGITAWAVSMLNNGEKLENPTEVHGDYIYKVMDEVCFADGWVFRDFQNYLFKPKHTWSLYEEPKPIVECLPHEFVDGQEVLVRGSTTGTWGRRTFHKLYFEGAPSYGTSMPTHRKCLDDEKGIFKFRYCLPYAENAHLEGQITDGEHGAVPKGYVPPHVPKFGDETYWMVGDEVVNLCTMVEYCIDKVNTNNLLCVEDGTSYQFYPKKQENLRNLYHKGSYVRDDGTVHEHIPTRPHKIIDTDTDGA